MTAGRKQKKAPEIIDAETVIDQPRFTNAMVAMQQDGQAAQQEAMHEVFELGQAVGTALTAKVLGNFCAAAQIHAFAKINESKAFKHLPIRMSDGSCAVAQSIDEFCILVFGRGYRAMADHKLMMERLGEETYENANRLGLNRSQLRLLIHLPEDTRAVVEEAMQASNKSEVVGLIQSLANQLDESKEREEELKATIQANEKLLAYKSKQLDEAALIKAAPPDEQLEVLRTEATASMNDCRGALIGRFSAALGAVDAHYALHGGESDLAFLAGLVGQLQADLAALRDRLGIPDVTPALIPEWVSDPAFGKAAD